MSDQSNDIKALANNCVKYLLIVDQKKLPIKKSGNFNKIKLLTSLMINLFLHLTGIVKNVCSNESKDFKEIIQQASSLLKKVFGIQLVEFPDKNEYILTNNLSIEQSSVFETHSSLHCVFGLLLPVLTLIFMNGIETKEGNFVKLSILR